MKIGFIGLPKSGKTTLFNALTGSSAAVSAYGAQRVEPNLAAVKVGDERVTQLSSIYQPRKTVHPVIEIVDFAGVNQGDARSDAFSGDLMKAVRNVDALAIVLRGFGSDLEGPPSPVSGPEKDRGRAHHRRPHRRREACWRRSLSACARASRRRPWPPRKRSWPCIAELLNAGKPVRDLALEEDKEAITRCFQFLTRKRPW